MTDWLPSGRRAAVCFTVDDVHPGRSTDPYEAGGDLGAGVLGRLEALLERHPQLSATLFVTPDWRERSPVPTRQRLRRVPLLRDHVHLTPPHRRGRLRLDRHPAFAAYLRDQARFEIACHGLHHLRRGQRPPAEFDGLGRRSCEARLRRARSIFADAGVRLVPGFAPPCWDASPALLHALAAQGFTWVASARDIVTPVRAGATCQQSGLHGVPLLEPARLGSDGRLLHFPTNWQATNSFERAHEIVACGGLLAIKAHAVKDALGFIAADGLDAAYCDRLDRLFTELGQRWGDELWWTTMGEIAAGAA